MIFNKAIFFIKTILLGNIQIYLRSNYLTQNLRQKQYIERFAISELRLTSSLNLKYLISYICFQLLFSITLMHSHPWIINTPFLLMFNVTCSLYSWIPLPWIYHIIHAMINKMAKLQYNTCNIPAEDLVYRTADYQLKDY